MIVRCHKCSSEYVSEGFTPAGVLLDWHVDGVMVIMLVEQASQLDRVQETGVAVVRRDRPELDVWAHVPRVFDQRQCQRVTVG